MNAEPTNYVVDCVSCGTTTTQRRDPKVDGVLAYCLACRGDTGPIRWDELPDGWRGWGEGDREYLVEKPGGPDARWRWTLADGSYQSGAHETADKAKAHADEYERQTIALFKDTEDFMAKGKKKKDKANGQADANGHGKTDPAPAEKPEGVPGGAVLRHTYVDALPVKLGADELGVIGVSLVKVTCEKVRHEEEIKGLKDIVKGLKEREEALVDQLKNEAEVRDVECAEYLLPTNEIMCVRLDTSEVVSTRAATAEDLQEPMFENGDKPLPTMSAPDDPGPNDIEPDFLKDLGGDDGPAEERP